jgi:hypothetical protein
MMEESRPSDRPHQGDPSRARLRAWLLGHLRGGAELALISLWALWIGRNFLTLDKAIWPIGREFGSQILSNHFWVQVLRCGVCALWNGSINGGQPALADIFGSTLHPLVAIGTLAAGVVGGAKLSIVGSLVIAGVAQWWIASSLRLGSVARVWSALLVVVGGHLLTRLDVGAVGLLVSTATASLTFAAALALGIYGTRRNALMLSLLGAITIVAGQGYLQASLIGIAPAFLFFVLDRSLRVKPVWREYALAFGLSLALAAVFLVPVFHFWPYLGKGVDPAFQSAQPLAYVPLNFVISDFAYLQSNVLGKLPYPYLYSLFVGWLPVLLAVLCIPLAKRRDYPALLCLATTTALAIFMASGLPLRWLEPALPALAALRHPPLLSGLAVPALLGLSAYGLDGLLRLAWPRIGFGWGGRAPSGGRSVSLAWLLAIPLIGSLRAPVEMDQTFLRTANVEPVYQAIGALGTVGLEWVAPPYGEHYWVEPALEAGLKVPNVVWAWGWKGRPLPQPRLMAGRGDPPPGTTVAGSLLDARVFEDPRAEYASVLTEGGPIPCLAQGSGGDLTIECTTDEAGPLVVQENSWEGWNALIDGSPALLLPGQWLSVEAPAGTHQFLFRYRPWDVPLGAFLSLAGFVVLAILWLRTYRKDRPLEAAGNSSGR